MPEAIGGADKPYCSNSSGQSPILQMRKVRSGPLSDSPTVHFSCPDLPDLHLHMLPSLTVLCRQRRGRDRCVNICRPRAQPPMKHHPFSLPPGCHSHTPLHVLPLQCVQRGQKLLHLSTHIMLLILIATRKGGISLISRLQMTSWDGETGLAQSHMLSP